MTAKNKPFMTLLLAFVAGVGATITPMLTNYYDHQRQVSRFNTQTEEMREKYKMIDKLQDQVIALTSVYEAMRVENKRLKEVVDKQRLEINGLKNRLFKYENQ